ncbi:putative membrane protein [Methanohalophilus levihalophilus]|uniref:DUF4870 domain-containing protein n=1 Tax=Methanohalophilus levihalophilus TaxID=1431282 RepID=UPI001AEB78DA|nr:hypothetical protein [Methanohalophilus levihalophilus]MBP2030887.1 putative membrane protein [Methanohalophilus levihalophilus]
MEQQNYQTSLGLNENLVAVLCYVGFWITGILFLLIEKNNRFVQFHAMQSILTFLPLTLIVYAVGWVPFVGWLFADFLGFFSMFLYLVLIVMAWRGSKFRLPISGKIAYKEVYQES